ncbi:hypothetical protein VNO77_38866 [Canavalia gladiata]|uniref:Uncharacterized protein n=1 Tax=Canavalia gladiata TaxID=3824 RepID=A0AAN9KC22_CANGL
MCIQKLVWQAIQKALALLCEGYSLKLGKGDSSFWYSDWSSMEKLVDKVHYVDIHDMQFSVAAVWNNGSCNLQKLGVPP